VQSLDTARCLVQLIALIILHTTSAHPTDLIPEYFAKMELLLQLGVSSAEAETENLHCIRQFRSMFPKLIPKQITDEIVGKLLGVLRTNQHELEDIGGSGLFVKSAIMEHSCYPNCSFTTNRNHIYVTAIRPIQPGERLTIDYANDYYSPSAQRIEYLQETYGFVCDCNACQGPDLKRPFRCSHCPHSIQEAFICPIGVDDSKFAWTTCVVCGKAGDNAYLRHCLEREQFYIGNPPSVIREIESVISSSPVHPMHHIIFVALHDLSVRLSSDARTTNNKNAYKLAINITQRVLVLMNSPVMPPVHHEKVLLLDKLGQLAVAAGDVVLAKESFRRAYEMSRLACGQKVPLTLDLYALAENTPETVEALVECYQRRAGDGRGDGGYVDHMDTADYDH
jgi:SET and MYND domain-containing protein